MLQDLKHRVVAWVYGPEKDSHSKNVPVLLDTFVGRTLRNVKVPVVAPCMRKTDPEVEFMPRKVESATMPPAVPSRMVTRLSGAAEVVAVSFPNQQWSSVKLSPPLMSKACPEQ
jgi:hypothetical protein